MTQELRIDLIIKMSQAIDDLLLSWDAPQPTLNEAIAAQIQSLARAISATTDQGRRLQPSSKTSTASLPTSFEPIMAGRTDPPLAKYAAVLAPGRHGILRKSIVGCKRPGYVCLAR